MSISSMDPRLNARLKEWVSRKEQGQSVTPEELCHDCPELLEALKQKIAELKTMDCMLRSTLDSPGSPSSA